MGIRYVYSDEVPTTRFERFGKLSLDGIEEMRERFPVCCHLCVYEAADGGLTYNQSTGQGWRMLEILSLGSSN